MKPLLLYLIASLLGVGLAAWMPAANSPDPVAGNPQSKIRVIVYQDLECPDCAHWHGIFETQIIPRFGSRVAFEFRDYPLPQHLWSFNAAVIARYLDTKQPRIGMAWRDFCFTHQNELTPDNLLAKASAWAANYGISSAAIAAAFGNEELFAKVQADQQAGHKDNVQHTPTILFNGVEATTPEQLESMLTAALR